MISTGGSFFSVWRGPLRNHHFAQIRRKEEAPPSEPTHVEKSATSKRGRDRLQSPDRFRDSHGTHPVALIGYHIPVLAGRDQLHGLDAEDRAQRAVEVRGAASPLQVAQHTDAGLLARPFLDLRGHHPGDAAQPGLAIGDLSRRGDELAPFLPGALRRDDQAEVLASSLALADLGTDALVAERDLRDQDHIGAAGDPGV